MTSDTFSGEWPRAGKDTAKNEGKTPGKRPAPSAVGSSATASCPQNDFAVRILDKSLNGAYVYDVRHGKNIYINSTYTALTGYALDDINAMSARHFFSLFHPGDRQRVAGHMKSLLAGETDVREIEYRFKTKNGRWVWCFSRDCIFARDEQGKVIQFVGTFVDITGRKTSEEALQESERRYRELVQNANSAIIRWRRDGTITFFNEYAQKLFGYTSQEMLGRSVNILVPETESTGDDLTTLLRDIVERPEAYASFINENICRDGHRIWMAWTNKPILDRDGRLREVLAVGSDVSSYKATEEALKKSREQLKLMNLTLETKVAKRTRELQLRANQLQRLALELSQAEEKEQQRIASILHDDLQQHLTALKFKLWDLMPRERIDASTQKRLTHFEELLNEGVQKTRRLSYELNPPVLEQNGLLAALEWLAGDMLAMHGLTVALTLDPGAEPGSASIAGLLYRSARELLFNTIKHAGVRKAALNMNYHDGWIRMEVRDAGAGFNPEAERRKRIRGGLGLFTLTERIHYLGGNVTIDSSPGRGCAVRIDLPQSARDWESAAISRETPDPGRGKEITGRTQKDPDVIRILIADDHPALREGLAALLDHKSDLSVVAQATNGLEAVELARKHRPHVVLIDVSMPRMDGIEAAARIRKALAGVRIVGLSMHDDAHVRDKMIAAGASAYVCKEAPAEEIIRVVRGKA